MAEVRLPSEGTGRCVRAAGKGGDRDEEEESQGDPRFDELGSEPVAPDQERGNPGPGVWPSWRFLSVRMTSLHLVLLTAALPLRATFLGPFAAISRTVRQSNAPCTKVFAEPTSPLETLYLQRQITGLDRSIGLLQKRLTHIDKCSSRHFRWALSIDLRLAPLLSPAFWLSVLFDLSSPMLPFRCVARVSHSLPFYIGRAALTRLQGGACLDRRSRVR
jgi:hypothetical protein